MNNFSVVRVEDNCDGKRLAIVGSVDFIDAPTGVFIQANTATNLGQLPIVYGYADIDTSLITNNTQLDKVRGIILSINFFPSNISGQYNHPPSFEFNQLILENVRTKQEFVIAWNPSVNQSYFVSTTIPLLASVGDIIRLKKISDTDNLTIYGECKFAVVNYDVDYFSNTTVTPNWGY